MQAPAWQVASPVQAFPQAPQCALSVASVVSQRLPGWPSQSASPSRQEHFTWAELTDSPAMRPRSRSARHCVVGGASHPSLHPSPSLKPVKRYVPSDSITLDASPFGPEARSTRPPPITPVTVPPTA